MFFQVYKQNLMRSNASPVSRGFYREKGSQLNNTHLSQWVERFLADEACVGNSFVIAHILPG